MRWQFTHAKVQNSSRTTRSRRAASLSGWPSGGVEPRLDADQFGSAAEDSQPTRSILLHRCARGVSRREGHSSVDGGGRMRPRRSRWAIAKSHVPIAIATRVVTWSTSLRRPPMPPGGDHLPLGYTVHQVSVARAPTARPSPSHTRGPAWCAACFASRPKRAPKPGQQDEAIERHRLPSNQRGSRQ